MALSFPKRGSAANQISLVKVALDFLDV